jgi:serine/threonine protein kinase
MRNAFSQQMLRVDASLGSGSYGNVYRATDEEKRVFALKRSELFESDGDLVLGTLREYIFHNSFRRPADGLCIAQRLWITKHSAFFLLPLFDGNLLEFARKVRGSLKFQDFVTVAQGLARGVKSMHSRGWMHRDIKPENVYVSRYGTVALGDFNLARFCDPSTDVAKAHRGSASTHVCTLWTRAPELVVADLGGVQVLDTSFEVDAFSVGASLLAVCAGTYVFGKQVCSDDTNETQAFLDGYFSTAGTDSFVRASFSSLQGHDDLPPFAAFPERLQPWMPASWTAEEKQVVCKLLSRLLDPVPTRRATVDVLFDLPDTKPSIAFKLMSGLSRKASDFTIVPVSKSEVPMSLTPQALAHPGLLWSQMGNWRVPVPLAIHAVLARRSLPNCSAKVLLFLLRAVHRFNFCESSSADRETVLRTLEDIQLDGRLWSLARQVESQPFLVCCLASWIHVYGTSPVTVDVLSSDDMIPVLQHSDVDVFFGAFGLKWKSQRSMLESWKRLNS